MDTTNILNISNNLNHLKIENIKTIFLNNILVQNNNGIVDIDTTNPIDYSTVIQLAFNNFLKKDLNEYLNRDKILFTLDGENFIEYPEEDNYYLTNLASNELKKFIFLCDFMADYYETNEKNIDNSDYKYEHKLKFKYGDYDDNIMILNSYNKIEYSYDNISDKIIDIEGENKDIFDNLTNDIKNNIESGSKIFDSNIYGKYHYKYKKNEFRFYTALINYNILLAYYYYISYDIRPSILIDETKLPSIPSDTKNKVINQISDKIILFKNLFNNTYKNLLQKAILTTQTTTIRKDLTESEKINNFNEINDKLIEINKKIEYKKDKDMMYDDNININIKDKIKTITIFVYYTIITFFLLNVILFNYYSEETNKFLSIIITIFLIFIYFVLKLFKNNYYEFFNEFEETASTSIVPIENYNLNEDKFNILVGNLELKNTDANDYITTPGDLESDRSFKDIGEFFHIFSCEESDGTGCPIGVITSLLERIGGSDINDVELKNIILESGTQIGKLIDEVEKISGENGEINRIKGLIEAYTKDDGIINRLNEGLVDAENDRRKLEDLNEKLSDLHFDLTNKNDNIVIEIDKLENAINDIQGTIIKQVQDISNKINDKKIKQSEKDNLEFSIKNLQNITQELFTINNNLAESKVAIEHNITLLKGDIIDKTEELLNFREIFNERSKKIADWYSNKTSGSLDEQIAADEIISRYESEKRIIEEEKGIIEQNKRNNELTIGILEQKIENINEIKNKKTYHYTCTIINYIDLNLDDDDDKENFINNMIVDIATLLDIPQTRIIIDNVIDNVTIEEDETNYITFNLKILPSPSYLKLYEHIKKMHELQIILTSLVSDDDLDSRKEVKKNKLLNTTYAKYIVYLSLDTSTLEDDQTDGPNRPKYIIDSTEITLEDVLINYINDDEEKYSNKLDRLKNQIDGNKKFIISRNIKEIKEILNEINTYLNVKYDETKDYRTYYDEVHPNLEKELRKYEKINNNNTLYDHIIKSKLNTTEHDLIYLNALNKFFIHLSIYLGIFYIYASHFNNFGYTINFFITIIVVLILLYYLFKDIHKKVRRNSSKSYWKYSKNYFE